MKKLISLVLCLTILFTGVIIYAEGINSVERLGKIKEIRQLIVQIKSNANEIADLRQETKAKQKLAQNKVKEFLKDKDSLSEEQLMSLTDAVKVLKNKRSNIVGAIKAHNAAIAGIRAAKGAGDLEKMKQSLINLKESQKEGIAELNSLIGDLNKICGI